MYIIIRYILQCQKLETRGIFPLTFKYFLVSFENNVTGNQKKKRYAMSKTTSSENWGISLPATNILSV